MEHLVSILIPAYNAEKWLGETIKSALDQTWRRCEVIIVDDGSSDDTSTVARRYESKRVKVVTQENRGASAARNRALSLAQGDFIQWLDADDLLAPDKIAEQLRHGSCCRDSMVLLSSAFGRFCFRRHKAKFTCTSLWQDLTPVEWFVRRFGERVWIYPGAWLVSRRLTDRIGPWNENLSFNDDGEYFARAVAACEAVKFIPTARSYYRQANAESLSKTITHKACESLFLSLELCMHYFLSLEESDRTRSIALQHLQGCLIYFYPDEREILGKLDDLARKLGGTLSPPRLKPKYTLVRKMFGWQAAKSMVFEVPRLKRKVFGDYDRMMSILTG